MTVISTATDAATLSLTLVAEFDASPDRVWQVWEDPRLLERWWGPPGFPATYTRHDFVPGGQSRYHLTGPEGQVHYGWWRFESMDKPTRIDFANGIAGDDGEPVPGVPPVPGYVTFEGTTDGTRMTAVVQFVDAEQMGQMVEVGMPDGMSRSIGQIDEILAAAAV